VVARFAGRLTQKEIKMSFSYAGSLTGGAPVVRNMLTGESMYVGQLLKSARAASIGGHVAIADVATEARETITSPMGICTGIVDGSSSYTASSSGTAEYGQGTTYTTTKTTVADTGPSEVEVTLIIPGVTLVRAPIYDTVWGTALTELVVSTGNADGKTVTYANQTIVDCADDFATMYCRSGANRGLYRFNTGVGTNESTVTVPFPNTIVAGDVFVSASCVLGLGGMDVTSAFDAIDGDNAMNDYYAVYYHELNLEESGKEFAIFSLWPGPIAAAT
jgi:hypothetical protein